MNADRRILIKVLIAFVLKAYLVSSLEHIIYDAKSEIPHQNQRDTQGLSGPVLNFQDENFISSDPIVKALFERAETLGVVNDLSKSSTDLGINGWIREKMLNENGELPLDPMELGPPFSDEIYIRDNPLYDITARINTIDVAGFDSISRFDKFRVVGPHTVQTGIRWDRLEPRLGITSEVLVKVGNDFELVNQSFEATLHMENLESLASFVLLMNKQRFRDLDAEEVLATDGNLFPCVLSTYDIVDISKFYIRSLDYDKPDFDNFDNLGLEAVATITSDAAHTIFRRAIIAAATDAIIMNAQDIPYVMIQNFMDDESNYVCTSAPSAGPTASSAPSVFPSASAKPSERPTDLPSYQPSVPPTNNPTKDPTKFPTRDPTPSPTRDPTSFPTKSPTKNPTTNPTPNPTRDPTKNPTPNPTPNPTKNPTPNPTSEPTDRPTRSPTTEPTPRPSPDPTKQPSKSPTPQPTSRPTVERGRPTRSPVADPTSNPTGSNKPTNSPIADPTSSPTPEPTDTPTKLPTSDPTKAPTNEPTSDPTKAPTKEPTSNPTKSPTKEPTSNPTPNPTKNPTQYPTKAPTKNPTKFPTPIPSPNPTSKPSSSPSKKPSSHPSIFPTSDPTDLSSTIPTSNPSEQPSKHPTRKPTKSPTAFPTVQSSTEPSIQVTSPGYNIYISSVKSVVMGLCLSIYLMVSHL